jgi:hypothetical protein
MIQRVGSACANVHIERQCGVDAVITYFDNVFTRFNLDNADQSVVFYKWLADDVVSHCYGLRDCKHSPVRRIVHKIDELFIAESA